MTHFMSSGEGQGQMLGFGTHIRVVGQRYWEQSTKGLSRRFREQWQRLDSKNEDALWSAMAVHCEPDEGCCRCCCCCCCCWPWNICSKKPNCASANAGS